MTITPEPAKPSVRAEDLPSAAEVLAELFPEDKQEPDESAAEDASQAPNDDAESAEAEQEMEWRASDHAEVAEETANATGAEEAESTTPTEAPMETPAEVPGRGAEALQRLGLRRKTGQPPRMGGVSRETSGKQANLGSAKLEGMELIGVNLRFADLHDVNLSGADLLLADLRDSCLVRLGGTSTTPAWWARISKARTSKAPHWTAPWDSAPTATRGREPARRSVARADMGIRCGGGVSRRASATAARYFVAVAVSGVASWLLIWSTKDLQLLTDSAVLRFMHSHAAATALPTAGFLLILPGAIHFLPSFSIPFTEGLYVVMVLPAIFPDGEPLGEHEPAIIRYLLRHTSDG